MSDPIFRAVQPVLPVRDVTKAIDYYTDKLGFELIFKHGEIKLDYAGVRRGSVELHLQWHDESSFDVVEKLSIRFVVENIDELFEEYGAKNVFHENTDLRDTDWGTREFAFYDPDLNALTFYMDLALEN